MYIEIKKITLKQEDYATVSNYPSVGLYRVKITPMAGTDKSSGMNDQLVIVSHIGGANMNWFCGDADDFMEHVIDPMPAIAEEHAVDVRTLKNKLKEAREDRDKYEEIVIKRVNEEPMLSVPANKEVSEDFVLNMLSVALHKKTLK